MALYQPKVPETVDAILLPDGNYFFVRDGKEVRVPMKDFEAKYVPLPKVG